MNLEGRVPSFLSKWYIFIFCHIMHCFMYILMPNECLQSASLRKAKHVQVNSMSFIVTLSSSLPRAELVLELTDCEALGEE